MMKKGHSFPKHSGFTASAGLVKVKPHFRRGGQVKVTDENVVNVLQKHMDSPVPPAHTKK